MVWWGGLEWSGGKTNISPWLIIEVTNSIEQVKVRLWVLWNYWAKSVEMLNYKAGHVLGVLVLMCRPDFIVYEIFDVDKILDWLLV